MTGVILYGPPAAGKDTVTQALTAKWSVYQHFQRLKAGRGRTDGYRMTDAATLDQLPTDDVLWMNSRYGSRYVVDRPHLRAMLAAGLIPVVHLGQPEAVDALERRANDVGWRIVELTCARADAEQRLHNRGAKDVDDRLAVFDSTPRLDHAHLRIDTSTVTPTVAAQQIAALAVVSPSSAA